MKDIAASQKRIYGLDILRAIAVMMVMHVHGQRFTDQYLSYRYYWWLVFDGVDMFFVLSGFLIGGILLRVIYNTTFTGNDLLQFWIRRWFRTLPNYLLVIIVLMAGYRLIHHTFPPKAPLYFIFSQNLFSPHPKFYGEGWSLAVEEWFYLLVPLGLFVLLHTVKAQKKHIILSWIIFVIAAVTIFRTYKVYTHHYIAEGTLSKHIRMQVFTRLDGIMYGFLGAYVKYHTSGWWKKNANILFVAGLTVLFGSRLYSWWNYGFYEYTYYSLQPIGTLLLLPKLSSIVKGKGIVYRLLTFISIISYSMYLINSWCGSAVNAVFKKAGITPADGPVAGISIYILFWIVTIFCSYLLYRFFEYPMTQLREKFRHRKLQEGLPHDEPKATT